MPSYLIKNVTLVNRGTMVEVDVLFSNRRVSLVAPQIGKINVNAQIIDGTGLHLLPGIIDDQVHFRQPGLTHKGDIFSESRAAVAGGITSYMEMPNTSPPAVTGQGVEEKYRIASRYSSANYSFYIGATNDNLDEIRKVDYSSVCGIKAFLGSSTGNMLVDDEVALEKLFKEVPTLLAIHAEDESTIEANYEKAIRQYGSKEAIPFHVHPQIRSEDACYLSSSKAVERAKRLGTRLHVLHISTEDEIALFENPENTPREEKRITSEVCVHHLWFSSDDYDRLGGKIKCNPAIKAPKHREALWEALKRGVFDVIATDHAPHTIEEKSNAYPNCPSGLPLVQHSLSMMLEGVHDGHLSLPQVVDKMCHAPADIFRIRNRGYLDEGYYADAVLVDLKGSEDVTPSNILYKCGWSPLEGYKFRSKIVSTFVNGHLAYHQGLVHPDVHGDRLEFGRW